jgi:hypothetical protein
MTDTEFLEWLIDRLVDVYGENPNVDFIHRLRKIATKSENKTMNISLEELKNLIMKYDLMEGEYPESSYEGLSVYEFICQELGN